MDLDVEAKSWTSGIRPTTEGVGERMSETNICISLLYSDHSGCISIRSVFEIML